MGMPKVRNVKDKMSLSASALLTNLVNEITSEIEKYLDVKGELEFDEAVNISFEDNEMRKITKIDGKYLLITLDNKNGSQFYEYEIQDYAKVTVYDLIWILEQIEFEEGV
jgi:hypothetical protein